MAQIVTVKLEDNDEIVGSLMQAAQEHGIEFGVIQGCKGKLKDFEIVLTKQRGRMEPVRYAQSFTMDMAHGKIEKTREGYNCRLNVTVLDPSYTARTGQLKNGKADGELEIKLRKVDIKKIKYA